MKCSVRVSHETQEPVWEVSKDLNADEFNKIVSYCESRPKINPYFVPVRTHQVGAFLHDLFLPTTFSCVVKNSYVIGRIFARCVLFVKDMVTFPVRFLNAFPRMLTNASKEQHPLYQYLLDHGSPECLLKLDSVHVRWLFTYMDKDAYSRPIEVSFGQERDVDYIDLPDTGVFNHTGFDYRINKDMAY